MILKPAIVMWHDTVGLFSIRDFVESYICKNNPSAIPELKDEIIHWIMEICKKVDL